MNPTKYNFRGMSIRQKEIEKQKIHHQDVLNTVEEIKSLCKEYKKVEKKINKYLMKGKYSPESFVQRLQEIDDRLFELVDEGV